MICNGFGYGGLGGGGFFMMIPMILIFAVLLYLVFKAIDNRNTHFTSNNTSSSKALNILNERYAKGEISEEEYISKKQKIEE